MTRERMTDAEMAETVGRARMFDAAKDALLRSARRGDPGARFTVLALRKRQDREAGLALTDAQWDETKRLAREAVAGRAR